MLVPDNPEAVGCRELRLHLYDFAEATLAEPLRAALARHVAGCAECQALLAQYRESSRAVQQAVAPGVEIPGELRDSLVREMHRGGAGQEPPAE